MWPGCGGPGIHRSVDALITDDCDQGWLFNDKAVQDPEQSQLPRCGLERRQGQPPAAQPPRNLVQTGRVIVCCVSEHNDERPSGKRGQHVSIFVLVAGPPGAGKSTLAQPLAEQLGLPLMAKDPIKEALMDVLGWPSSVEQRRTLGRAAVMALLEVASTSRGAVLDSTFFPYALPRITALPGPLIEVRCNCAKAVAQAR